MEFRLGNQQRHSVTAVLLSAAVVILGLVILDLRESADPDPVVDLAEISDSRATSTAKSTEAKPGQAALKTDGTSAGRSNARFALTSESSSSTTEESTTTTLTTARVNVPETTTTVAAAPSTTLGTTTESTTTTLPTTTTTTLDTIIWPSSTFTLPTVRPWPTIIDPTITVTSTTVDDDDDPPDTKECRGNRPGCDDD